MLDNFQNKILKLPIFFILLICMLLSLIFYYVSPIAGVISFVITVLLASFALQKALKKNNELSIHTLELAEKEAISSEEVFMKLPFGMLSYNENYEIKWLNRYMEKILPDSIGIGSFLYDIHSTLVPLIKGEHSNNTMMINDHVFRAERVNQENLLYFVDVTSESKTKGLYEKQQTVFGVIFLDNYDEITQSFDDNLRSNLNSMITAILNQWAVQNNIYLKRTGSDRFFIVLTESILTHLEKEKFHILDIVRDETSKKGFPLTISIGIGRGTQSLNELGSLAQSSLDLALGRGGDQVAIKQRNGKAKFYGGKTNPVEKRTRVRARVISHALRDLIIESKRVLVMGHTMPDMDSIGSAVAILKVAEANDRSGYLVIDKHQVDSSVERLMHEIESEPELYKKFISREKALEYIDHETLVVIVDTHVPDMVAEPKLLTGTDKIVVIDHHRRGENFIHDPILVYMEPYASSTAELVTELLEYQPKRMKLTNLEATMLLAGIIVDTKSFTLRTGSRTFEAASYLRKKGAETILVQNLLKEDFTSFQKKNRIINTTTITKQGIAIAKGSEEEYYDQILIAQSADTLLNMTNVIASFVIARRNEEMVSISARSLGDVNVQVIMEKFGGGGHLSNAAAQIYGKSILEIEAQLKQIIDEFFREGEIK